MTIPTFTSSGSISLYVVRLIGISFCTFGFDLTGFGFGLGVVGDWGEGAVRVGFDFDFDFGDLWLRLNLDLDLDHVHVGARVPLLRAALGGKAKPLQAGRHAAELEPGPHRRQHGGQGHEAQQVGGKELFLGGKPDDLMRDGWLSPEDIVAEVSALEET